MKIAVQEQKNLHYFFNKKIIECILYSCFEFEKLNCLIQSLIACLGITYLYRMSILFLNIFIFIKKELHMYNISLHSRQKYL